VITVKKLWIVVALLAGSSQAQSGSQRWTPAKAKEWYQHQPWLVGSNYIPASAINELEMWQADTFDAPEIDKELGWAEGIGMNTMRVFLHDLLWQQDSAGFQKRMENFLAIAARHHIRPLFVLFDSCWDPHPKLGPQHPPIPGVHNSGWVQSPGADALEDASQEPRLQAYVKGVVGTFANDSRILGWDVWNEPSNTNGGAYGKQELKGKQGRVQELLPKVFEWARSVNPSQPLTSGLWEGDDWSSVEKLDAIGRIQLEQSDVISFHNYSWPEDFEQHVRWLEGYGRPIICTEFMARSAGSTFDTILPVAKQHHVGAINWGLVVGKTQTNLPWDSWDRPYVLRPPTIWFHEVFYADGKPYRQREADLIRELTGTAGPGL
jgi:Cellulase (glycosyl hydrolase family 5)